MATVKFYGDLKRFEPTDSPLELCVESFGELMSGLLTQLVGLRQRIAQGYYKVRIGKNTYLSEDEIKTNAVSLDDNTVVHITPVVKGAGKGGGLQMVLGAVLIAVAYINPFGYLSGPMVSAMYAAGASMMLGGAISMLSRPPDMNNKIDEGNKNQSTSFSNLRNLTPQGRPIPILLGKMMTSIVLISQGTEAFDDISPEEKAKQEEERKQAAEKAKEDEAKERENARIRHERTEDARDAREEREAREQEAKERQEKEDRDAAEAAYG